LKYIFLDFDGVLHGEEFNIPLFVHMDRFCNTIRPFLPDVNIIISSSWRETHSLEHLKSNFHQDIREFIVGETPVHVDGFSHCGRYKEILAYCKNNQIHLHQWIALDDMHDLFPENCPNLIAVQGFAGLSPRNLDNLVKFLQND
jgi:hypothetical protein